MRKGKSFKLFLETIFKKRFESMISHFLNYRFDHLLLNSRYSKSFYLTLTNGFEKTNSIICFATYILCHIEFRGKGSRAYYALRLAWFPQKWLIFDRS